MLTVRGRKREGGRLGAWTRARRKRRKRKEKEMGKYILSHELSINLHFNLRYLKHDT
jgi:hypothetical protein